MQMRLVYFAGPLFSKTKEDYNPFISKIKDGCYRRGANDMKTAIAAYIFIFKFFI